MRTTVCETLRTSANNGSSPLSHRSRRWVAAAGLVAAYGWWVTGLDGFTTEARAAIAVPVLAVWGAAAWRDRGVERVAVRTWLARAPAVVARLGRPSESPPGATLLGVAAWVGLIAVIAVVQLWLFSKTPRSSYPTASSLLNQVDGVRVVQVTMFGAWAALGWAALRR